MGRIRRAILAPLGSSHRCPLSPLSCPVLENRGGLLLTLLAQLNPATHLRQHQGWEAPQGRVTLERLAISNMWEHAAPVELSEREGILKPPR